MVRVENRDPAVSVPLLPETQLVNGSRDVGASISGAIFNISTSMVGAGIMSIPSTFKVLGVIPSFVAIIFVAFLVEVTVEFLLKYTLSDKSNTYGKVMGESFGKCGSVALQVCVMINNLGALIIYLIIIGDVLSGNKSEGIVHLGVLQEWFGVHWWNSRPCSLLFIVVVVMLPLLLMRRIDSLRHASAVSVLLAGFFVAVCSAMAMHALWVGKTQKPRLVPDFTNSASVLEPFTTIPIIATAFGCHVNVHPVREELGQPSEMSSVVRISLVFCIAIYIAIGFFGYLLFGDSIVVDMLINFEKTSESVIAGIINDIVRLSYAIHLMLVFPVMNYALRANVDELFFPKRTLLAKDNVRFYCLTGILVVFIYLAAVVIPNVWYFFQFMGTTTVVFIMFIFPSSVILRDVRCISTMRDKVLAVVVIFLAVGTSIVAILSNLYRFFGLK